MKKRGFETIFISKDARVNTALLLIAVLMFVLIAIFVNSVGVEYSKPESNEINTSRNVNFTFTPTWNNTGEKIGNCSLWTNFTGTWQSAAEFNGTQEATIWNGSSNITNGSTSWINYTFTHDLGNFVWSIACRNGTQSAAVLNFSAGNRTIAVDTLVPKVIQTSDIFQGFNTSSSTPTITFNITDINGTGVNLTTNGDNSTLNVTLFNVNNGGDTSLTIGNISISNGSLTCSATGDSITSTQCTLSLTNIPLTNGTKNLTVSANDRARFVNITSFTFTVDQIAPRNYPISTGEIFLYNITHSPLANISQGSAGDNNNMSLNTSDFGGTAQGRVIYAKSNWTDNLTRPRAAYLQWYNESSSAWTTVNTTLSNPAGNRTFENDSWSNLSFKIPSGVHNEFEGKNVSFRLFANDTLGNFNSSASVANITITVNDTTKPTLSVTLDLGSAQRGNRAVNGTNTSDTTPTIVWNVTENNPLKYIAIQIDGSISAACNKFINYTSTDGNVESNRNGSITVSSTGACPLGNGTRVVRLTTEDTWGNSELYLHSLVVQTGEAMNLSLGLINTTGGVAANLATINQSNITPYHLLTFNVTLDGGVSSLKNMTWTSSCQSTLQNYTNGTAIAPFNYSGCKGLEDNYTVTVTAYDHVDNSITRLFRFAVDDSAPSLTLEAPSNGFSTTAIVDVNVTALDRMSRVDTIGYYLDGGFTLLNHTINGSILTGAQGQNISIVNRSINFTPGTHTIKVAVNDTLGNVRNSSVITFTYRGPFDFMAVNTSLMTAAPTNYTNVSVFNSSGGLISDTNSPRSVDETYELFMALNTSGANMNVSINFNGSAANWGTLNFTVEHNESRKLAGIQNNQTATIVELISFNTSSDGFTDSIDEFISDANYYGFIDLILNATNVSNTKSGGGNLGGIFELWYFSDEADLTSKTNITELPAGTAYTKTTSVPYWNNTLNTTIRIYVPHFSAIALVNNTGNPTVNVTIPTSANQSVAAFTPNITVSADAVSCVYSINTSVSNKTMALSSQICLGSEERFANLNALDGGYNFTFTVTDSEGNINYHVWKFNVTDNTAPNNGPVTSSAGTISATVTITGTNESVNATVAYGTANTSLSSVAMQTDFNATQDVSLTGLTASTTYYYNVTVCDFAGNCKTNTTVFSFATSAAASSSSSSTSSSSGGGGGGAVPSNIEASTARLWDAVAAGSSATLSINNAKIAVTEVQIQAANSLTNAELSVESLKSNPLTANPSSKVYQYLQLTKTNILDADTSKITISFKVPLSWLVSNGVKEEDIVLYRYSDGKWNALPTSKTGNDGVNALYESTTPGFSTFAIGMRGAAPQEEQPAQEAQPETPSEQPQQPAQEEPKAPVEPESKSNTLLAVIVVLLIVVAAAVGYFMWQKNKAE